MEELTHVAFALLCFEIFEDLNPMSAIILTIFSILPDIDHSSSVFGRIFRWLSFELEEKFGHRSITHSVFSLLLVFLLASFSKDLSIPIILGYASHLFLDMLTVSGIKLLYPLNYNFVILGGPVSTGSIEDRLIGFSSSVAIVGLKFFNLL